MQIFVIHLVNKDVDYIIRDLRKKHHKDSTSAPEASAVRQRKKKIDKVANFNMSRLDGFARLQHNTQNYNRIYVYKADSDSILILLLTNVQGCAIMKLSDREVPYQALLFKKNDRLEFDEWRWSIWYYSSAINAPCSILCLTRRRNKI